MTDAAKKILEEFEALSEDDQRWLAEVLVSRMPGADDEQIRQEWADVAVERLERAERGEAKLVSYDEVRAEAQAALRRE